MSASTAPNPDGTYNTKSWENPFSPGTYLHTHFEDVISENRDVIIIIDDYWGRRGTGKTVGSLQLAAGMDQNGGLTKENVSMDPVELRETYTSLPKRTGLVFDEGEVGASNRNAMSKTNRALREICSMGRVEEKYLIVNTPVLGFIDKDILKLADIWITMLRKGLGLVHGLEREPYSETLLRPKKQFFEFRDIERGSDLRSVFNYLSREKNKRLKGEEGTRYIEYEKHTEIMERRIDEEIKKREKDLIGSFYNHPEVREAGIPQRVIAEAAGVSQPSVANYAQALK